MRISVVKVAYAMVVLAGILYAFTVLRGPNGIPGLMARRHLAQDYETGNQQLQREIEQKQERIERLKENPAEQEFEIRQRLKLAKPGEKIFIIDQKK